MPFRPSDPPPLSLYVHLPWCVRKCPYCDFNSHAARGPLPEDAYVDALLRDLEHDAARAPGREVQTVFLGGGTPSLFAPAAIARLLAGIGARVPLAPQAEITLEANPGTVDTGRFAGYRAAGVNRLSIGIQSFDPEKLTALGRIHGRDEALAAAAAARAAGFDNFNLDLMFGLPGQTPAAARADLETAHAQRPTHLSLYQLTLEPNTLFHARPPALPEEDTIAAMQEELQALLARHDYRHYEVSAHARPGHECRHNRNYWEFGDYLGVGAGAHGKVSDAEGITRTWKLRHPDDYLAHAGSAAAVGGTSRLAPGDLAGEFMLNALRLTAGVPAALFAARTGLPLAIVEPALARARERGLLEGDAAQLRATPLGRRFLNDLVALFL